MKKTKTIYKILISLIIIIATLLISSSRVQAVYFNNYAELRASRTFYCIQHGKAFRGGTWNPISVETITSDDNSYERRKLAYILYKGIVTGNGGYNYMGPYQIAIWKWYKDAGISPRDEGKNGIYREAEEKTKNKVTYSNSNAIAQTSNSNITMAGEVGSLKFNELVGKISEIEITWNDNTKKSLKANSKVAGWIEFYSDNKCTKPLNIADMGTKTIYFKNLNNEKKIKNLKVKVKSQASGYAVTITRYSKHPYSSQQDLISATKQEGKDTEVTKNFKVIYSYGNIKIKKLGVRKINGQKTTKDISATFKLYCTTLKKWVSGDANGNKKYVDNINNASSYKSGTTVSKLYSTYKYALVEVKVDDPAYNPIKMIAATSNLQKGLELTKINEYYSAKNIVVYANATNVVTAEDEASVGGLEILKIDEADKNITLEGAEFIIYREDAGWVIKNSDGSYNYNGKDSDLGVSNKNGIYTTGKDGTVILDNLEFATYHIYEIKAPEGYQIEKQKGYDSESKRIDLGSVKIESNNSKVKYTVENIQIVNLEGKVWLDNPKNKGNMYNSILDDPSKSNNSNKEDPTADKDELIKGMTVNLCKDNQVVATTKTDENGYYKFENIKKSDLSNYYVEFLYDNTKYVVVDTLVGTDNSINSKAKEYEMEVKELDDNNLNTIQGKAVTERKKDALTLYGFDNNTYTYQNINLGLVQKIEPEFDVTERLEYIKISMKGYTYTYKFGDGSETTSEVVPTAQKQKSSKSYTKSMYPSDVAYNDVNKTDELKVYTVYRIDVQNLEGDRNNDDLYVEEKLYLSSLTNSFDSTRYEIPKVKISGRNETEDNQFKLWSTTDSNSDKSVATYNLNDENNAYINGIDKSTPISSYIQFRVKDSAVRDILNETVSNEKWEKVPTVATVKAYHEYLRTDNVWKDNENVVAYEGAKRNDYKKRNNSNDKYYVHKSIELEQESSDLYIKFKLGNARTISGTVFEDTSVDNNIGNGRLDNNEKNRGSKVKVELLTNNTSDAKPTKLYKVVDKKVVYEKDSEGNDVLPDAVTYTDTEGNYAFEGVIPGYYYIRFTYGDGTQEIKPANTTISSKDYKSTIINTSDNSDNKEIIKNIFEANKDEINNAQQLIVKHYNEGKAEGYESAKKLVEWYKYLKDNSYSIAVDDLEQRGIFNEYSYVENDDKTVTVYDKNNNKVTSFSNINAYSPIIGISIENDINNENAETAEQKIYSGFNFGIIKQPGTTIKIGKMVTNVELTNQAGTTLVSANPTDKTSKYVSALDDIIGGSKDVLLQGNPEIIFGAGLEATYEISLENESVKDYIEPVESKEYGTYYKYGKITENASLKAVKVEEVVDNLDNKYASASIPKETLQKVTTSEGSSTGEKVDLTVNDDGTVKITGWEKLRSGEKTSISYTVSALANVENDDTTYSNKAKVTKLSLDNLTTLNSDFVWEANSTKITIIPSTGENRSNLYWMVGTIALGVMVAGIVLIKKKVI